MNRRIVHLLAIIVSLCLVITLLPPTMLYAQTGTPADTLVIGTLAQLDSLDPAAAGDVFRWEILTHLYTGLTRQRTGSLTYELALAKEHLVSADGLTHTFMIRSDAAFSDGTPITAQTFADSLQRGLRLTGAGSAILKQFVQEVRVDKDNGALVLVLLRPVAYIEQLVALPPFFPVHPRAFDPNQLQNVPSVLISNGIYQVADFKPNERLTLQTNPQWQGTAPKLAKVSFQQFNAVTPLRSALQSHAVDMIWPSVSKDDEALLLKQTDLQLTTAPGLQTFYWVYNLDGTPFDRLPARQGTTYLLDRERAVSFMRNTATALYSLVPPEVDPSSPTYPKLDQVMGHQVLTEGNYSRYRRLEGTLYYSRLLYGDLVAQGVRALNFVFALENTYSLQGTDTEPNTFIDQITRGIFDSAVIGVLPIVPHTGAYLDVLLDSKGIGAAGAHYHDQQVDQLLHEAALATDPVQQQALYVQAQQIALQAYVVIPLWQSQQSIVAWKQVQGIVIEPNYILRYDQMSK